MWGILVGAAEEIASLPPGKILKAQLLLANLLFDAGITKLPINLIQKLRGEMEFWSSRCHRIKAECAVIDRMSGHFSPKRHSPNLGNQSNFYARYSDPPTTLRHHFVAAS